MNFFLIRDYRSIGMEGAPPRPRATARLALPRPANRAGAWSRSVTSGALAAARPDQAVAAILMTKSPDPFIEILLILAIFPQRGLTEFV